MSYTAFVLDDESRSELLSCYTPKFSDVIAHHVTLQMGVNNNLIGYSPMVVVTGRVSDESLEALLVTVDGKSVRPDGGRYHITLSLDRSKGRKPAHSNVVIKSATPDNLVPFVVRGSTQICN